MLIAIAFMLVMQLTPNERLAITSATYRVCRESAASMFAERECLKGEADLWGRAVEAAANRESIDPESQAMWRRLVEHDCQGEYDMAGGSNSAPMRRDICLIEMRAERTRYLLRRGNF